LRADASGVYPPMSAGRAQKKEIIEDISGR
jgi:hypothetical protein